MSPWACKAELRGIVVECGMRADAEACVGLQILLLLEAQELALVGLATLALTVHQGKGPDSLQPSREFWCIRCGVGRQGLYFQTS